LIAREGQRFDEDERRLEIGGRAEWEALLAVVAHVGGDFRQERDLFSDSPVNEADGVLLLDLGTVANAETAMNAERSLLRKLVFVCSIVFSQFL